MPKDAPGDDDFWNLLAAYIDAIDADEQLRNSDPVLADRVARHVESCALCQSLRQTVLTTRGAREKKRTEGSQ